MRSAPILRPPSATAVRDTAGVISEPPQLGPPLPRLSSQLAQPAAAGGPVEEVPTAPPPEPSAETRPSAPWSWSDALGRGKGPFGARDAAFRLLLLPDPSYRSALPWLRHRLARAVGADLYTAARHLQRDVPVLLCVCSSTQEAEERRADLGHLRTVVLSRLELMQWGGPTPTTALARDDGLWRAATTAGPLDVPDDAVVGVVVAELQEERDRAELAYGKDRLGRPVAPIRSGMDTNEGPRLLMDVVVRDPVRVLRVRADQFDFTTLGEARGLSALRNLRTLAAALLPDGRGIDERFRHIAPVPGLVDGISERLMRREVDLAEYSYVVGLAGRPGPR